MTLDELRAQIDEIDDQLTALFVRRMEAAGAVARLKGRSGGPVRHPDRERAVLNRAAGQAGAFGPETRTLFSTMMDLSRAYQHRLLSPDSALRARLTSARTGSPAGHPDARVACQGVPGAYAGLAAQRVFPRGALRFCPTWRTVFDAVEAGQADFGVLPVENSSVGPVREVLSLMAERALSIAGEVLLPVEHCLCAPPGVSLSGVRRVLSHPQALAQCAAFLASIGAEPVERSNTAAAAGEVARSGASDAAALCSREAAAVAGLEILRENVQDESGNSTRFFVIGRELLLDPEGDRVTLMFDLPHVAGALYRILSRFAAAGLNLTRLESIPLPGRPFEYRFCVDFDGSVRHPATLDLICALDADLPGFSFLGNYRVLRGTDG